MNETTTIFNGVKVKKITLDALVIGTGAAGYNAALRLDDYGVKLRHFYTRCPRERRR